MHRERTRPLGHEIESVGKVVPLAGLAGGAVAAPIGMLARPALVGISQAGAAAARASAVSTGVSIGPGSASATGPSSDWVSWRSGFFSSSCWMKAASSRCENCSNLIACCSCGVIANVWREARMRLGPIRMCPPGGH